MLAPGVRGDGEDGSYNGEAHSSAGWLSASSPANFFPLKSSLLRLPKGNDKMCLIFRRWRNNLYSLFPWQNTIQFIIAPLGFSITHLLSMSFNQLLKREWQTLFEKTSWLWVMRLSFPSGFLLWRQLLVLNHSWLSFQALIYSAKILNHGNCCPQMADVEGSLHIFLFSHVHLEHWRIFLYVFWIVEFSESTLGLFKKERKKKGSFITISKVNIFNIFSISRIN